MVVFGIFSLTLNPLPLLNTISYRQLIPFFTPKSSWNSTLFHVDYFTNYTFRSVAVAKRIFLFSQTACGYLLVLF